jgi:hypothetical protein
MNYLKRILLLTSIPAAMTFASCGDPHNYGKAVADNFVKSCTANQQVTKEVCTCVFEKIEKKYTFKEFADIDKKAEAGNFEPEFVQFAENARAECSKSTP